MKADIDDMLESFEQYMDNISKEKLDKMLFEIDNESPSKIEGRPKKPISFNKACALLDVSRTTLDRWVKVGLLQKFYFGSKPYLDLHQIEKAFTKGSTK